MSRKPDRRLTLAGPHIPDSPEGAKAHRSLARATRLVAAAAAAALFVSPAGGPAATTRATLARSGGAETANCPWRDSRQPIASRVAEVMHRMTLSNEIDLVDGHGTPYTGAIPRLCIPSMYIRDGPSGLGDGIRGVTQFPAGISLAATFDPGLAKRFGQAIGAEAAGKGVTGTLGPSVDIDRDPRWGRVFETYGEDPYLESTLAASDIEGVQSKRVMVQVKHFDAYNQETYRRTRADDAIVSDRALHEIYLPAFEAATEGARAASVLCGNNLVNGHYDCQNHYLLTNILKQEWDFPGFVISDHSGMHSTIGAALAGTDLARIRISYYGQALREDVERGKVARAVLNGMVQRILTEMFRFNLINKPLMRSTSATVTTPAHVALSNEVAEAGTTLLKNAGNTLPLSARKGGKLAVIGSAASASPADAGAGSAYVIPSRPVSPLQGLRRATGARTHIIYRQGLPTDASLPAIPASHLAPAYSPTPVGGSYSGILTARQTGTYVLAIRNPHFNTPTYLYLDGRKLLDSPGPAHPYSVAVHLQAGHAYRLHISGHSNHLTWATPSLLAPRLAGAVAAARSARTAIVVVYEDTESEATDRPTLSLPSAQNELISRVAAANPRTVVVVDAGAPIAMPWLSKVAAVVDAWYPGQTNGRSLAAVLFGRVDPGGHLPVTFPQNLSQVPAHTTAQFPGNGRTVQYSEGIDVGYRWYDANDITPLFPFGYGLSYTRFQFSHLRVTPQSSNGVDDVRVSATVTNVGSRAGTDVAQLYLGDPGSTGEPPRQLVGYKRVTLGVRKSAILQFRIAPRQTWWWDPSAPGGRSTGGGWSQTAGQYDLYLGDSSALANLPLTGSFTMTATPGARQVVITPPRRLRAGRAARVRVRLTAAGNETLSVVRIALQAPQGWTVNSAGGRTFADVSPSAAPTATFSVRPPSYAPNTNAVIHATARLGPAALRGAGVTVTVER